MIYAGDRVRITNEESKHFDKCGYAVPVRNGNRVSSYQVNLGLDIGNIVFWPNEVEKA